MRRKSAGRLLMKPVACFPAQVTIGMDWVITVTPLAHVHRAVGKHGKKQKGTPTHRR